MCGADVGDRGRCMLRGDGGDRGRCMCGGDVCVVVMGDTGRDVC